MNTTKVLYVAKHKDAPKGPETLWITAPTCFAIENWHGGRYAITIVSGLAGDHTRAIFIANDEASANNLLNEITDWLCTNRRYATLTLGRLTQGEADQQRSNEWNS